MLVKSYAILQILISVTYTNGYDSYCEQPETVFKTNCKALNTESYDYNDFFPISKNNRGEITLVFYVKGEKDAHILLSPTPNLPPSKEQEKVYEIVLGAGNNKFSSIRRKRLEDDIESHYQTNFISPDEWREFRINVSSDGIIKVGNNSRENEAFLFWKDPDPFPINYYSFSSYDDAVIDWFHQCSNQTEDPIIRYHEEELKFHLFSNYDKQNRPTQANTKSTQITIQSSYVDLNTANGIFELRGTILIEWSDKRLTWNPDEQHGLDSLEIEPNSIWRPGIKLTNQVFVHDYFLGLGKTTVSSNGVIKHEASSNIQSRCQISTNSQLLDTYTCKLNFTTDFHAYFTFSQLNYSDVISPWILTKTQSTYSLDKNETKSFMETVLINVTLQKNISQPTSCSEFENSSSEKLRCQLLSSYNSSIFSNTTSQDDFHELQFKIFYADIDVSGVFQMIGEVEGNWDDHQLTWEPSEYNYTYFLQIEDNFHQMWIPKFKLVYAAFFEDTFLFDSDHIASLAITYEGAVTLRMRSISIQAKCQVTVKSSRPWNNHTCQLHFESNAPEFEFKYKKFDYKKTTGARADIVSPWMVYEFREVKRLNGSVESSNNSIFIDVELHRDMGHFESARCIAFASSYEEELKCHLYSKVGRLVPMGAFFQGPQLDMTISYVDLNIENEIFQMKGKLVLKWAHENIAWDPKKFGGLFVLKIEEDPVWKPALILKNEVFEDYITIDLVFLGSGNFRNTSNDEYFGAGHLEVTSNGALTWTLPMNIDTRCNMTPNSWPWDPQTCQLNFTTNTMKMHSRINDSSQMKSRSGTILSLWKITEIFKANNTLFQFRLMVTLENKSNSLQVVLCSTLTGLSSVMLSSFLISPTNRNKLTSKLLSLLLLVIFLAIMMTSIPHFTTQAPNFLNGFVMLLSIVGTSSCITAYLVRLTRKSHSYNPSLNVRFTSTEENECENYTMKTALIQGVPLMDDKSTGEASAAEKSQHNWLKTAMVVELSSFAICSIIVVFLIMNLMN